MEITAEQMQKVVEALDLKPLGMDMFGLCFVCVKKGKVPKTTVGLLGIDNESYTTTAMTYGALLHAIQNAATAAVEYVDDITDSTGEFLDDINKTRRVMEQQDNVQFGIAVWRDITDQSSADESPADPPAEAPPPKV
jgi:hypothetical protein